MRAHFHLGDLKGCSDVEPGLGGYDLHVQSLWENWKQKISCSEFNTGISGTVAFGEEDILGSGDCDLSPVTPYE